MGTVQTSNDFVHGQLEDMVYSIWSILHFAVHLSKCVTTSDCPHLAAFQSRSDTIATKMKPMRDWFKSLLICGAAALAAPNAYADIAWEKLSASPSIRVYLTNTVSQHDYVYMQAVVDGIERRFGRPPGVMVELDSVGGSVDAAVSIGRLLRRLHAMAVVNENAQCLSACVFILAGAPIRAVDGAVGIHRPYDPGDTVVSAAAQARKYKDIGARLSKYLRDMNIPTRLYEDSLFISPDQIKLLSREELEAYGLSLNDPYVDEASAVRRSRMLHISRAELAGREGRATVECHMAEIDGQSSEEEVLQRFRCRDEVLAGKR